MNTLRLPYFDLSSAAFKAMRDTKHALETSQLDLGLIELVYLRVSQINGCAFCLEMHSKALRARGESQRRLDALAGWRVTGLFTARERSALDWAESVTRIESSQAPDELYLALKAHFSDSEISDLTLAIASMNAFNRVAIAMRQ